MVKPTPGPWAIRRGHSVVEVRTAAGLPIAQTTSDSYWENFKDESLANARLIAAAPKLLDALDKIAEGLPGTRAAHRFSEARTIALAAIAEARGE